ncbi:MAG: hypothetical protein U0075_23210 [Thermomicrobiales bacterium]
MTASRKGRRAWLLAAGVGTVLLLGGCTVSPEAARAPGEAGADVGNHGQPVQLLEPADRFERIFFDVPYDGPSVATEDTAQQ